MCKTARNIKCYTSDNIISESCLWEIVTEMKMAREEISESGIFAPISEHKADASQRHELHILWIRMLQSTEWEWFIQSPPPAGKGYSLS